MEALARQEHCRLVDVEARFAQERRATPQPVLFVGDGHCNDDGYALMADEFARAVRPILATRTGAKATATSRR